MFEVPKVLPVPVHAFVIPASGIVVAAELVAETGTFISALTVPAKLTLCPRQIDEIAAILEVGKGLTVTYVEAGQVIPPLVIFTV